MGQLAMIDYVQQPTYVFRFIGSHNLRIRPKFILLSMFNNIENYYEPSICACKDNYDDNKSNIRNRM
jgi:hypothetical protein